MIYKHIFHLTYLLMMMKIVMSMYFYLIKFIFIANVCYYHLHMEEIPEKVNMGLWDIKKSRLWCLLSGW